MNKVYIVRIFTRQPKPDGALIETKTLAFSTRSEAVRAKHEHCLLGFICEGATLDEVDWLKWANEP
jgi:hypothetical protein